MDANYIYLSSGDGAKMWDYNCDNTGCTSDSPCHLRTSTGANIANNHGCHIVMNVISESFLLVQENSSEAITLYHYAESSYCTQASISIHTPGHVRIQRLIKAELAPPLANFTLKVTFGTRDAHLSISNLTLKTPHLQVNANDTAQLDFTVTDSTLDGLPPLSRYPLLRLTEHSNFSTTSITVSSSTLKFDQLLSSPATDPPTVHLIATTSNFSSYYSATELSHTSNVSLYGCHFGNIAFNEVPASFVAVDSIFKGMSMPLRSALPSTTTPNFDFTRCNFTLDGTSSDQQNVTLVGNGRTQDVNVTAGVTDWFFLGANFTSRSVLTTDFVTVLCDHPHVLAPNFIVTHEIKAGQCDTSQFSPLLRPVADSHWNFSSLNISDDIIDFSNLDLLTYAHTSRRSVGFRDANETEPGPAKLRNAPKVLRISWTSPDPNFPQQDTTKYTLYQLSAPPPQKVYILTLKDGARDWNAAVLRTGIETYAVQFWLGKPCSGNIPLGFYCDDGHIVTGGDVSGDTLVISPNSGTVIINGTANYTGGIIIEGPGSTIEIRDCLNTAGDITIVVDPSTVTKAPINLITQNGTCPGSLSSIPLKLKQTGKDCRKVKQKTQESVPGTLTVLFSLDNTACNTKWIILGCVLGAVVVLLVVLMLVFTLNRKARVCIRPYSKRAERVP